MPWAKVQNRMTCFFDFAEIAECQALFGCFPSKKGNLWKNKVFQTSQSHTRDSRVIHCSSGRTGPPLIKTTQMIHIWYIFHKKVKLQVGQAIQLQEYF